PRPQVLLRDAMQPPDRLADEQVLPEIGVEDPEAHRRHDSRRREQRDEEEGRVTEREEWNRDRSLELGPRGRRAGAGRRPPGALRSEEHTSELQSRFDLVCRLLLEKKKNR